MSYAEFKRQQRDAERAYWNTLLIQHCGCVKKVAAEAQVNRTHLYTIFKRLRMKEVARSIAERFTKLGNRGNTAWQELGH